MTLIYDFDIFDIVPDDTSDDPDLRRFLDDAGFERTGNARQVALFRDALTAEALRNAPDALRNYFLESGFGLNTFDSGAPRSRYPAKDEVARLTIIDRLTANASRFHFAPPDSEDQNAFVLADFLDQLAKATPIALPSLDHGAHDAISTPVAKNQSKAEVEGEQEGRRNFTSVTARLLRAMPRFGHFRKDQVIR